MNHIEGCNFTGFKHSKSMVKSIEAVASAAKANAEAIKALAESIKPPVFNGPLLQISEVSEDELRDR